METDLKKNYIIFTVYVYVVHLINDALELQMDRIYCCYESFDYICLY